VVGHRFDATMYITNFELVSGGKYNFWCFYTYN